MALLIAEHGEYQDIVRNYHVEDLVKRTKNI